MKRIIPTIVVLLFLFLLGRYAIQQLDDWQLDRRARHAGGPTIMEQVYLVQYADEDSAGDESDSPDQQADEALQEIGCGDFLVPVDIPVSSRRLVSVINALSRYDAPDNLYNPLKDKEVIVERVIEENNGIVRVRIAGDLLFGGICDAPRFKSQLEETIRLHVGDDFIIELNGSEKEYSCIGDESDRCLFP